MIIGRLIESLKNRHWSTLFLELFVVVVGIFLGLQANMWFQTSLERKELDAYLKALTGELTTSVAIYGSYAEHSQRSIDGLTNALKILDGATLSADELNDVYSALTNLSDIPTPPQRTAVMNAMQSDGMLRLIDSQDLLQSLGEILSANEPEVTEFYRYLRIIAAPPFSSDIVQYELGENGEITIAGVDWQKAAQDPDFRLRVLQGITAYRRSIRFQKIRQYMNQQALDILISEGYEPGESWAEKYRDALEEF